MSNEEIMAENVKLKERIKELELLLQRKSSGNSRAYDEIRAMIIKKVDNELIIPEEQNWKKESYIKQKKRQLMRDLLWEIRVRRVTELRTEHIQQAKTYIEKYILSEE